MSRKCVNCGAAIPADAYWTRICCSRRCKEQRYRARQRERRPDRPAKPAKRPSVPQAVNLDAIGARLRRRERDILDDWKNRR
jgi:hypothetical protein